MRKTLWSMCLAVLLVAGVVSSTVAKELVVLHTNDTHSELFPFGPQDQYGGIARISTLMKQLRSKNERVLALHAGDVFVGTFAFNKYLGYPELKVMEGLYDAMGLGNHEFDLGPVVLGYILAGVNPVTAETMGQPVALPILGTNVDLVQVPPLGNFVRPWMIKEVGGLKVGVLAVVTDNPVYYSPAFANMFGGPYEAAGRAATQLRSDGCDVVIAISHLGKAFDVLGLSTVPGIDIIVGGHSHEEFFAPDINGKIIVQAGEFGKNLGELKIDVDDTSGTVTVKSHELHPVTQAIRKDPTLLEYVNALREGIYADPRYGPVYSRHVAKAMWDLEETWLEEDPYRQPAHRDTPLGNLVVDAIRNGSKLAGYPVDCALEANGYIGHKTYAGKVLGNDVMRTVPYGYDPMSGLGFKIKVVSLFGMELLGGLEYTVRMAEYTDDFSLQVSNLTFEYDSTRQPGTRVDPDSVRINGYPLEPYQLYRVALNEKLLALLSGLGLNLTGRITDPSPDMFEFNLVEDYMNRLNHLEYTSEGRIIDTALLP